MATELELRLATALFFTLQELAEHTDNGIICPTSYHQPVSDLEHLAESVIREHSKKTYTPPKFTCSSCGMDVDLQPKDISSSKPTFVECTSCNSTQVFISGTT